MRRDDSFLLKAAELLSQSLVPRLRIALISITKPANTIVTQPKKNSRIPGHTKKSGIIPLAPRTHTTDPKTRNKPPMLDVLIGLREVSKGLMLRIKFSHNEE